MFWLKISIVVGTSCKCPGLCCSIAVAPSLETYLRGDRCHCSSYNGHRQHRPLQSRVTLGHRSWWTSAPRHTASFMPRLWTRICATKTKLVRCLRKKVFFYERDWVWAKHSEEREDGRESRLSVDVICNSCRGQNSHSPYGPESCHDERAGRRVVMDERVTKQTWMDHTAGPKSRHRQRSGEGALRRSISNTFLCPFQLFQYPVTNDTRGFVAGNIIR